MKGASGAGVSTGGKQLELKKNPKVDKAEAEYEDEFDADEEEAMIQAAIEIEKKEGITE